MEEDPQPLSSHEFLNFEDAKSIQSDKNKVKKLQTGQNKKSIT